MAQLSDSQFLQHEDDDVIIPDGVAFTLIITAQLLLVSGIYAAIIGRWDLFAVLFFVYLTSIIHWRAPRFSSWRRYIDYFAVIVAVVYGTFVSTRIGSIYTWIWCSGMVLIAVIFIMNESAYYLQVMKLPSGASVASPNVNISPSTNYKNAIADIENVNLQEAVNQKENKVPNGDNVQKKKGHLLLGFIYLPFTYPHSQSHHQLVYPNLLGISKPLMHLDHDQPYHLLELQLFLYHYHHPYPYPYPY